MNLIDRLIARAKRRPYVHLPGYMERFWLFRVGCRRGQPLFSARVHHILRSDKERGYHDHPWPYVTVILRGGYWECRPIFDASGIYRGESGRWRGPGTVLVRRARCWHRLELPKGETTWTLFLTGPKVQEWGFMLQPALNKIHYTDYEGAHE